VPGAWASCARASCAGAVPRCVTARPALPRRCCAVRCVTSLVRSDPGVGMSIFFSGLCTESYLDVCPVPGSRASLLRRRVLPFGLGGLCCLFASATRVRRGPDVRALFCFQATVRNAVLVTAQCPGLWLRPCAAVCCRSPYPLPVSSPS